MFFTIFYVNLLLFLVKAYVYLKLLKRPKNKVELINVFEITESKLTIGSDPLGGKALGHYVNESATTSTVRYNQVDISKLETQIVAESSDFVLGEHRLGDEPLGVYENARESTGGSLRDVDPAGRQENKVVVLS